MALFGQYNLFKPSIEIRIFTFASQRMKAMHPKEFYQLLLQKFPFEPTLQQHQFLSQISDFCIQTHEKEIFLLKGFAGTGKTSLLSALVQALPYLSMNYILLASTGRAAKVMSVYTQKQAFTIHRKIYSPKRKGGAVFFSRVPNMHKNTLFVVDEASMIADIAGFEHASLLDDLMSYVYQGEGCKLLILGDSAQLPPVHQENSPALQSQTYHLYGMQRIRELELSEVMRQAHDSGILMHATSIREAIAFEFTHPISFELGFKDVVRLKDGYDILEAFTQSFDRNGVADTVCIVRSNQRANAYNQQIRQRILFRENALSVGDLLMVVKNNYFWLDEKDEAGFIANGDIVEVLQIYGYKELYGFTFASVKIRMMDYPNQRPLDVELLLDTLESKSASLTSEESQKLYQEVLQDYMDEPKAYKRLEKVKTNPYFNALQVKFSYAITCHKSQGGQWATVFVEQPYLADGPNTAYYRWLYTAFTRAKERLYLIGFTDDYFEN